jgi:transposase
MSNNAAERTLRCVAVGRHNWTFAGSDEGGRRAAANGSPMCSRGCMITPQSGSTNSCHGIGAHPPGSRTLPDSLTPTDLEHARRAAASRFRPTYSVSFTGCMQ